jgi:hypothetical protein
MCCVVFFSPQGFAPQAEKQKTLKLSVIKPSKKHVVNVQALVGRSMQTICKSFPKPMQTLC